MAMTSITGKVSMHVGKKFSRNHNSRDYDADKWNKDGHIDYDRTERNITLIDKDLRDLFAEKFGDALMEYDKKNEVKHPERVIGMSRLQYDKLVEQVGEEKANEIRKEQTINAYYSEQKKKANEVIIQLSDGENFEKLKAEVGEEKAYEIHKEFLMNACQKFIEDNPNFAVFGAYFHFDETTPHLHLDFLPIEENSKRGLSSKVNLDGALKSCKLVEGGISRGNQKTYDNRPYVQWLKAQRADLEQQAGAYINVKPSEPSCKAHLETYGYKYLTEMESDVQSVIEAFSLKGIKNAKERNAAAQVIVDNAADIISTLTADIEQERQALRTAKERYDQRNAALDKRETALSKWEKEAESVKAEMKDEWNNIDNAIDEFNRNKQEIEANIRAECSKLETEKLCMEAEINRQVQKALQHEQSFQKRRNEVILQMESQYGSRASQAIAEANQAIAEVKRTYQKGR